MGWTRIVLALLAAGPPPAIFNVAEFGAVGDGRTNDTAALQKAIDACARAGGGVVLLPAGNYLSGTLILRSNLTLRIGPGATLSGSRSIEDYRPRHLLYAAGAENIAIDGGGTINGNGDAFWNADFRPLPRPSPLIELVGCRNVRIENIAVRNAPGWTIHPKDCDGVRIRGISIVNHLRGPNTDGIDPDSSRNVFISDSYIEAGDDCIVLKTTRRDGPVRPCENVAVTNCVLVSDDTALKLGTESYADIRHCRFANCILRDTRVGIGLYAKDGGVFEDIRFANIAIQTYPQHPRDLEWPVYLDLERRTGQSRVGAIRDVTFSGLRIVTRGRVLAGGMPGQPLEGLRFQDVVLRVTGFERLEGAAKPRGSANVRPVPAELNFAPVPAALIFNYIRGLDLRDVQVTWDAREAPQERHALYAAHVEDLTISGFTGRQAPAGGRLPVIALDDVRNAFITASRAAPGAGVFVQVRNSPAGALRLEGNDLRHARAPAP